VVREVARSLSYVHTYGDLKLVHRDVAPPNILLAYVGDVKLTDFGLARSILKQEHTAPGVVFGAPPTWRPSRRAARWPTRGPTSTRWASCCGSSSPGSSSCSWAGWIRRRRWPSSATPSWCRPRPAAPWITPALDRVVTKALAPDRDARFSTAEELRQALNEVIGDVAPRADAGRVAEFLRGIYADTIDEERIERDRFLKEVIPSSGPARPTTPTPRRWAPPSRPLPAPDRWRGW
jgi:serine/threonine-protein kinase